ncbi:uncharacterized protein LOC117831916 [Notolabrus celidotus]|uniref:uncharacterized protein LOC117831916 n=1 Tax=Notolabrus celidotus TaxID=1203425 RepID=UPI00148F91C7|nr:uncharacterized protein LOC117831916 [Notolabrus celidotus]
MKFSERKVPLLSIKENIEMELFSSEEPCVVITTLEKEEECSYEQRNLEHPLVPDSEEEEEEEDDLETLFETPARQQHQAKIRTVPLEKDLVKPHSPVPGFMEDTEIEMEVFPPPKVSGRGLEELKSIVPSTMTLQTPNKSSRLTWRRQNPPRTGLVVKDVVCLPRGHYLEQLERPVVPRGKERAALVATGMTARITIDGGWSAKQMESRLVMLFWGRFVKREGQRFSFTYIQCVQGSKVLFFPDPPAEGWTGEQVLRTAGHGALYILSHQDYPQVESDHSEMPVLNKRDDFCPEEEAESCLDEDSQPGDQNQNQPPVCSLTEEVKPDLETILRLFQQENVFRDVETHIQVRRGDLLNSTLESVRRPSFCFRTTPIISFTGEETDGQEGPLREFFRLTLLELQQTSVFQGFPGRLFLTFDLSALEDRKYYEAGVLVGWSLAQGGPGPCCLHPALYQWMCGQSPSLEDFSWRDIVDTEVQLRLQQLHSSTDVTLLSPSLCDWLSSCGIPEICSMKSADTPVIYGRLMKHYIYHRVSRMNSQFTEGLNSCGGLWDIIQSHWEVFAPVMTSVQQPQPQPQPLTLEQFKQLFSVCYSPPDSQLRAAEEATAAHWETALTLISDCKADFSFEELLTFITGADHVPPLGFSRLISLHFYSKDESMSDVHLPYASTCTLELFLPAGVAGAADVLALLSRAVHKASSISRKEETERTAE